MKFHKNLFSAVIISLQNIFEKKYFADKVIEYLFKENKKWGSRDRKFVAETIYEIVRYFRLYSEIDFKITNSEKINYWHLLGIHFILKQSPLPDWDEFNKLKINEIKNQFEQLRNVRKFRESIPDWLDSVGENELSENWDSEIHALNIPAKLCIRVNRLKISKERLQILFKEIGIEAQVTSFANDALIISERQNLFKTELFKKGFFEVQDVSSQKVAEMMQVEPGMRVIDACAGGGGKSLHIASLMENKGKIISLDTEERKLIELKKRASRNGVNIIETRLIDSNKIIKRLHESADRLLLDVPCSGLGVLKRNPDAKWKLSFEKIEVVKNLQMKILTEYTSMLKKDGILIYSTCSILPSENELQIKKFLALTNNFMIIDEIKISPAETGFDGFYICKLKKIIS